jgi:nucleotide-sensitive chloride channel 1A
MGEDDAFIDADGLDAADAQELSEVGRVRSDFVNVSRYNPY